jgi:hypothetical protein
VVATLTGTVIWQALRNLFAIFEFHDPHVIVVARSVTSGVHRTRAAAFAILVAQLTGVVAVYVLGVWTSVDAEWTVHHATAGDAFIGTL